MSAPPTTSTGANLRAPLLTGLPVTERRLSLSGVETAVLEGGDGPPVVLLHGPAGSAAHWLRVIPPLVGSHRVVAPDLPGQGESLPVGGALDAERVLAWLGELIDRTCATPPALVGYAVGGAIAARFAADHGDRISRLVLVDALGLVPFAPAPEFGVALHAFLADPTPATHDALWRHCALDLDRSREELGARWKPFEAYDLDRARTPAVQAALGELMDAFGLPAIPSDDLARIAVPTALVWGRHDVATPLATADATGARLGWALHVIEDAGTDPPIEQPDALVRTLRTLLAGP